MKWFKHIVESGDDPDIDDAIFRFGPQGYYFFFRTLEILAREFDVTNPGESEFQLSWFSRRFRLKVNTIRELSQFFSDRKRIHFEFYKNGKIEMVKIKCPKLKTLCDEYTQKQLPKLSGQAPDVYRDKLRKISPLEVEEDKEEERIIKEQPKCEENTRSRKFTNKEKKIFEELKLLASRIDKKYKDRITGNFNPYMAISSAVNDGFLLEDIQPALEYIESHDIDNVWGCYTKITTDRKNKRETSQRQKDWEKIKEEEKQSVAALIQGIGRKI